MLQMHAPFSGLFVSKINSNLALLIYIFSFLHFPMTTLLQLGVRARMI